MDTCYFWFRLNNSTQSHQRVNGDRRSLLLYYCYFYYSYLLLDCCFIHCDKFSQKYKREKKINSSKMHKKTARIVGILFIIATAAIFAESIYEPFLNSPDYLDLIYSNKTTVIVGLLLESIMIPAMFLIPIFLFPVLKKYNKTLALGYIGIRSLESALIGVAQIIKISLISLGQDYLNGGGANVSDFQNTGNSIQSKLFWVNTDGIIYVVIFAIGAFILNFVLYKSKLIPRWLSIWGLFAAVAIFTGTILYAFTDTPEVIAMLLIIPIAVQEMVFAVRLIVKGFNSPTVASKSVK